MRNRLHSLSVRISALYIVGALLLVVAIAIGSYVVVGRSLTANLRDELNAAAQAERQYFELALSGGLAPDALVGSVAPRIVRQASSRFAVRIYDPNATLLATNAPEIGGVPSNAAFNLLSPNTILLHPLFYDDVKRLYAAVPVQSAGRTLAIIELSSSRSGIDQVLTLLGRIYLFALAVAGLLAILGGLWLARLVTRPIRNIQAVAGQIATGSAVGLRTRVGKEVERRDEIGALANSLNEMAQRLDELIASRNTFVSTIGHELRTPLTTLKGNIINLQDELGISPDNLRALTVMEQETDRLHRLVEELLDFARSGGIIQAQLLDLQPLDLAALATDTCTALQPRAARLGLQLDCPHAAAPILVQADRDRLKQVLVNLLDNALKFTPPGGCVSVSVAADVGVAVLEVADSGPGIPVAQREAAFIPYQRGEAARDKPGLGLGLAIARQLAVAHGATLTLQANHPHGTLAVLRLPLI